MRMLLALLLATAAAAQDRTGSIRGTVVDAITHQPVRKAEVFLGGNDKPVLTDASGSFLFDYLKPGDYPLKARHRNYPQPRDNAESKTVTVKPAEQTGPLTLELVPGASISGHIFDEDGDPLEGCNLQIVFPGDERPRLALPLGTLADRGAYRLFNLLPGKYTLIALCQTTIFQPRPLSAGPDPPVSAAYPKQLYPEKLELLPGVDRTGIDFKMKPVPVTWIDVAVSGDLGGPGGRRPLSWSLAPVGSSDASVLSNGWRTMNVPTGKFRIDRVFAGSYMLLVSTGKSAVELPIHVSDRPIETVVQLQPCPNIVGIVVFEDAGAATNPPLNRIEAALIGDYTSGIGPNVQEPAKVKEDGSFALTSVFPGQMHLQVSAPHAFLKSASLGDTQLTDGKIDLSTGAPGVLRIVLSSNTATIHGTAPAGSTVGIAAAGPSRFQRPRIVEADKNGHFTIEELAPGKYRIGAMPLLDEEHAKEIALQEGETLEVELKTSN